MRALKFVAASAAAALLIACGGGDSDAGAAKTKSSTQAVNVDAKSPLDTTFRLKGAEAIDIDALFALLPEGDRPTYDEASFDKSIGAMVVTNLTFAGDDAEKEKVIVARAEFYGRRSRRH